MRRGTSACRGQRSLESDWDVASLDSGWDEAHPIAVEELTRLPVSPQCACALHQMHEHALFLGCTCLVL